jgi:hypothetical protein
MNCAREQRIPADSLPRQETARDTGHKRMHPDDYMAHLAWVTATRFHELARTGVSPEKTVRCYITG